MKLLVERFSHGLTCTIGKLFIDDDFTCFTLEDPVREIEGQPVTSWKIDGDTAIPMGIYEVRLMWSNRFQHFMPRLIDVPGFAGILIHAGNTNVDTHGCLLLGMEIGPEKESVLRSRVAYDALMAKLNPTFQSGEPVTIEVR